MRVAVLAAVTLALAGAACKSFRSSDDPIAREQEIVRDVKWKLAADPRFDEVLVQCKGREVILTGRVTSAEAAGDATRIASETRDVGQVFNRIEIRPK